MLKLRMKLVKEALEKCYSDIDIVISPDNKEIAGTNELVTVLVTAPAEPDGDLWTIKIAPSISFEGWDKSEHITEEFKTSEGLEWFIIASDGIYKKLFVMLSKEYEALKTRKGAFFAPYYILGGCMGDEEEIYD